NACDGELWQGIYVEGNSLDSTQSESLQGVVELKNGATIENAVCAINVGLRRLGEEPTCGSGGGIVKASNASFINNLQALEFGPYHRHKIIGSVHLTRNASNFSHCNFIVNNQALFDLNEFEQHINLIDMEDIQFHSCHFTSLNNKGIAIQSLMSASFSLDDGNMLTSERSNISDFDIGILIQDGKPSYVYNTNFNNNFTGILTEKSDAIYIAGNHFQIPYESYHGPTCGVSLTNCPYFYIKNNIFHGEINCNYGLIINHSGKNDNIIKNNMFTHLRIANLAFGENSDGLNGIKGLQFHCNWFENNDQDIVVSDYDIETGSIRYIQGELGMGCGNIFTDNGFSLTSDNYSFQYHYKNNSHRENPFHVPLNIQTVANDDHLCNQIGLENPLIAPPEVPFNWQNTLYDYYNLISTSLENTKRSYQERGYYDIPIDWYMYFNEEVIPDELAHQVSLYYEMTNLQSQLSGICQTALYCIYNDSLFNTSLYHDWLIRTHTPETDYLLAESYYENGNFNECFQIINAIPGSYEGYNEIENQNYLSYYNLKEYLRINEMTWSDLEEESAEKSQLFDIASSGINEAACVARAIVNSFFDVSYEPLIQPNFLIDLCMYIINLNNDSSLIPINDLFEEPKQNNYTTSIDQIPEKENSLTIYPNPASTLLTINNGNQIIREISLCDVLGKEIKTYTINASKTDLTISHLNKGFYFLRILTDKGMVNKSFVKE
ncbi:MAG: T9SS type A sorting domain-containing protein, partial [Bacteroidales bacterium]|nr:T9SS type A sorting domain-containing protein [Bacteroidales bacterium]